MAAIEVSALAGSRAAMWVEELARLRTTVFREYPYLYDGTLAYERDYLATYFRSRGSVCVIVREGDAVIGAATGLPLVDEDRRFAEPFVSAGLDREAVFYFGESVLLPAYRGRGIGHRLMDEREQWARALPGIRYTSFCAVERSANDPRRPPGYVPHDGFWQRRGYVKRPDLRTEFSWKEIGETVESPKPMVFWIRDWER